MRKIAPYVVVLVVASYLYFLANQIDYVAPKGRIGPEFWPKAILTLTLVVCAYEIVKNLFSGKSGRELAGVLESILEETPNAEAAPQPVAEKTYPHLLWSGIALTIAYVVLIEYLGFFLCTALYLGVFMILGRYRRIGVVAATSLIGSLTFMFIFMKIVYVSLPLGREPFINVSLLLMQLLGIR